MERIKYITNKELLVEIDRSKKTYSYYQSPEHSRFDAIVHDMSLITETFKEATLQKRIDQLTKQGLDTNITSESIVYRHMTCEHIPLDPLRKRRPKILLDKTRAKTPFPSYKHYIFIGDEVKEVGRSHWKGDLETGDYCIEHGKITNRLAMMLMLLVERYSKRGNWRGYSYNDEMRSHALLQLSQVGLEFDESKSDNPFAFYTQVIKNCFTRIFNVERKIQHVRDDLLLIAGVQPSFNRQIDHEISQRFGDEQIASSGHTPPSTVVELPKKRGRKPKAQQKAEADAESRGDV